MKARAADEAAACGRYGLAPCFCKVGMLGEAARQNQEPSGFTELPNGEPPGLRPERGSGPERPIGFGRHGVPEENRQGFGLDGDPTGKTDQLRLTRLFGGEPPRLRPQRGSDRSNRLALSQHGVSAGKTDRLRPARRSWKGEPPRLRPDAGTRRTCKGFGRRRNPGELPGLRPQRFSER